jgi:ABC-type multidrug transport system permease subunit
MDSEKRKAESESGAGTPAAPPSAFRLPLLLVLLAKDLRRAWRNPLPWLINLIVPLAMTALIGMVFGGGSDNSGLGKIRFAVVNENPSRFSDFLRRAAGSLNQTNDSRIQLEPVFMDRTNALREINANHLSAVLIIPTNFVSDYLAGRAPASLQLIKNPAESIHPAVLEELLGAVVTALNEISRNFNSGFPEWRDVVDGKGDYHQVSAMIEHAGDKLKSVEKFVNPPLVSYEKTDDAQQTHHAAAAVTDTTGSTDKKSDKKSSTDSLFAYLLIGLAAMFLLFLGQNGMTDLHRELRKRTFERYQTLHQQLWPFIVSKIIFTVVMLLFCSVIMLGGGSLIFGFHWQSILLLIALSLGYAGFVAALFAVLVALVPDERRAGVLNNLASMALGLVGGCAFPPKQLPAFLREHVTPLLPSYWFADTLRRLECGSDSVPWLFVLLKFAVVSAVLIALAAFLFKRKFQTGQRA